MHSMSSDPSSKSSQHPANEEPYMELTKQILSNLLHNVLTERFNSPTEVRSSQCEVTDNMKMAGSSRSEISRYHEEAFLERPNLTECDSKSSESLCRYNRMLGDLPISPFIVLCRTCRSDKVTYCATCQECKAHFKSPSNPRDEIKKFIQAELRDRHPQSSTMDFCRADEETKVSCEEIDFDTFSRALTRYCSEERTSKVLDRNEVTSLLKGLTEFILEKRENVGSERRNMKPIDNKKLRNENFTLDVSNSKTLFLRLADQMSGHGEGIFLKRDVKIISEDLEALIQEKDVRDGHKRDHVKESSTNSTERQGNSGCSLTDLSSYKKRSTDSAANKANSPLHSRHKIRSSQDKVSDSRHLRSSSRNFISRNSVSPSTNRNHSSNRDRSRSRRKRRDAEGKQTVGRNNQDCIKVPRYEQSARASPSRRRTDSRCQDDRLRREERLHQRRLCVKPYNDRCAICPTASPQPRSPSDHMSSSSRNSSHLSSARRSHQNRNVNDNENASKRRRVGVNEEAKESKQSHVRDLQKSQSDKLPYSPWNSRRMWPSSPRRDNEESRRDNEECRRDNEKSRRVNKECRRDNEESRRDDEECRRDNEECRSDNEESRRDNEECRRDNEECRSDNKECRSDNEESRRDNEECRRDNEECRRDNEECRRDSLINKSLDHGGTDSFRHRRHVPNTVKDSGKNNKARSEKVRASTAENVTDSSLSEGKNDRLASSLLSQCNILKLPVSSNAQQSEMLVPRTKSEPGVGEAVSSLSLLDLRLKDHNMEVHGSHSFNSADNFTLGSEKTSLEIGNGLKSRNKEDVFGHIQEMFITRTLAKMIGRVTRIENHKFRPHIEEVIRAHLTRATISRIRLKKKESKYRYLNCITLSPGCDIADTLTQVKEQDKCSPVGHLQQDTARFDVNETQILWADNEIIPNKCPPIDDQEMRDILENILIHSESLDSLISDMELDKETILEMTEEFCDISPLLSPLPITAGESSCTAEKETTQLFSQGMTEKGFGSNFKPASLDCTSEQEGKVLLEDHKFTKMSFEADDVSEEYCMKMEPGVSTICFSIPSENALTLNSDVCFDINNCNNEEEEGIPKGVEETKPSTSTSFDDDYEKNDFSYKYDNLQSPIVLNAHDRVFHINDMSHENKEQNPGMVKSPAFDGTLEVSEILGQVRRCDDILATAMESAGVTEATIGHFMDATFDLDSLIFGGDTMNQQCTSLNSEETMDQFFFNIFSTEDGIETLPENWNTDLSGIEDHANITQSNFLIESYTSNNLLAVDFAIKQDLEACEAYCQERKFDHILLNTADKHNTCHDTTVADGETNAIEMNSFSLPESDISGRNRYTSGEFIAKDQETEDIALVATLNNETKKSASRKAQTVTIRNLEYNVDNNNAPKRSAVQRGRLREEKPRRLQRKRSTHKLKSSEEFKDATIKPVDTKNQVVNKTQVTPMDKFRRPQTMLRRQLRSMSGRNTNASEASSILMQYVNCKGRGTKHVDSNNNSDSPGSSATDLSCEKSAHSSSAIEDADQKTEELVSKLKARCRELEKHYNKRYQAPMVRTFSNSILSNQTPFSGDPQLKNRAQGNKLAAWTNVEERSANGRENERASMLHSDSKLKSSMINFVTRIQGGYGDQFPVSCQTTKEKRRQMCNRYLEHHGVCPIEISSLDVTDQKQRNKRKTSGYGCSYQTILNPPNGTLLTTGDSHHETLTEQSRRTKIQDEVDSTQCSDSVVATTSSTSINTMESLGENEGDSSHHNNIGPGRKLSHKSPKTKCSSETSINRIKSSATVCHKPSTSASTSRLTARSLSPGHKLSLKIDKFERDFQANLSTFYNGILTDKEAIDLHRSTQPEKRHPVKPLRKPQTAANSKAHQREKLLKILHKFEKMDMHHETSDQTSDFRPGTKRNLSQIQKTEHGTFEEAKLGSTSQKTKVPFRNQLISSIDSQGEESMQECGKKIDSISSDRETADEIRSGGDATLSKDTRRKDGECNQNLSGCDLTISSAMKERIADIVNQTESKTSVKQFNLPSLETPSNRHTFENQPLSFSPGISSRAEKNDIRLPSLSNRDVITIPGSNLINQKEMYALLVDTPKIENCHSPDLRPRGSGVKGEKDLSLTNQTKNADSLDELTAPDVNETLITLLHTENTRPENTLQTPSVPAYNHKTDDVNAVSSECSRDVEVAKLGNSFLQDAADNYPKEGKLSIDEIAEFDLELNVFKPFSNSQENPLLQPRLQSGKCTLLSPIPEDSDEELEDD